MRKFLKIALIILMVIILSSCSKLVSKDKQDYETYYKFHMESTFGGEKCLPDIDEVLNNDSFQFKHYKYSMVFVGYGTVVSQELSEEEFEVKREELNKTYTFLNEPIYRTFEEESVIIPTGSFEIDGYSFKVISDGYYPLDFGMIAFSEEENRILYFAYYDQDLDYIDDMVDFVKEIYPGWNKW